MLKNLMEAMTSNILEPVHSGSYWEGWKPVPSIRSMSINVGKLNALLETVGLKKKFGGTITFKKTKYDAMNRYIKHQLIRAEKSRKKNSELYWRIAFSTMERSISFRVSSYNRVFPGWWHKESMTDVVLKLRAVEDIIRNKKDDLIYKRVYIEKDGGKSWRPLGVPTGEWRIVMHMHNNWLRLFLAPTLNKINHAYQPGKGCLTAWKEVLTKVHKAKYIYEFDLKQFFPGVNVDVVTNILQKMGVPKGYTYYLENIGRTTPQLPSDLKLDESQAIGKKQTIRNIKSGIFNPMDSIYREIQAIGWDLAERLSREDGYDNIFEWAQAQWAAFDSYGLGGMGDLFKGLPQGLNTSPVLSILTLKDWVKDYTKKRVYSVMYADDGLFYSNRPFKVQGADGIEIHPEKSRFLKWNGKWQVESYKFLGIEYLPKTNIIRGKTRKGSTLEFDAERLGVFDLLKSLKPEYEMDRLERLAKSNIFGLIQSKLYQGTWEELISEDKEWKVDENSWWGKRTEIKGHKTMSSTAIEWMAEAVRRTMKRK